MKYYCLHRNVLHEMYFSFLYMYVASFKSLLTQFSLKSAILTYLRNNWWKMVQSKVVVLTKPGESCLRSFTLALATRPVGIIAVI